MENQQTISSEKLKPAHSTRARLLIGTGSAITTIVILLLVTGLHTSAEFWAKCLVFLLTVGLPGTAVLGHLMTRRISATRGPSLLKLYLSIVIGDLALVWLCAHNLQRREIDLSAVGLGNLELLNLVLWTLLVIGGLLCLAALGECLEKSGWLPTPRQPYRLVPRSLPDKVVCVLFFAPVVGFSEEFLFRGFLLRELQVWIGSGGTAWAAAISCVAFALSHASQGVGGVLRHSFSSVLFILPVLAKKTLYPSIAAHAVYVGFVLLWVASHRDSRSNRGV
jgi:membrane protease YdiL (CAAX protease family)